MRNKNFYTKIKSVSERIDRMFYFVNSENLCLKEDAMQRVANDFAKKLGFKTYGSRCGDDVQNPKSLLEEINVVGIENVDIICIIRSTGSSILLSYDGKVKFIKELEIRDENTGIIAESLISEEETSEEPVYEE